MSVKIWAEIEEKGFNLLMTDKQITPFYRKPLSMPQHRTVCDKIVFSHWVLAVRTDWACPYSLPSWLSLSGLALLRKKNNVPIYFVKSV